jgi:hypothetical protein
MLDVDGRPHVSASFAAGRPVNSPTLGQCIETPEIIISTPSAAISTLFVVISTIVPIRSEPRHSGAPAPWRRSCPDGNYFALRTLSR